MHNAKRVLACPEPFSFSEELKTEDSQFLEEFILARCYWDGYQCSGVGAAKQHTVAAFREGWAWSERKWSQVTADTGIGNPKKATAEKGQRFFKDLTEKLGGFFYELAKADLRKMYE